MRKKKGMTVAEMAREGALAKMRKYPGVMSEMARVSGERRLAEKGPGYYRDMQGKSVQARKRNAAARRKKGI